ncbi:TIGR00725 family protein [Rhodococcus aetherivorans]
MDAQRYVGVVGPAEATAEQRRIARQVGGLLAARRAVVVTGGLGGVMAAASRGAAEAGGTTLGLLPGDDRAEANPYLTVSIPTGLGEMRNALLVRTCEALIAVGGSWGTLSEIALAVRTGVPVISIGVAAARRRGARRDLRRGRRRRHPRPVVAARSHRGLDRLRSSRTRG